MRKWIALLGLLVIVPVCAQDGSDQIELGANLTLGMSQSEALSQVTKHFEAKPMNDASQFVVFAKRGAGEKPKWEGILAFHSGKLVGVERLWAYDDDERSVALAKSLFGALSNVMKSGRTTCQVEDQVSDAPDASGESIYLNCGKRSIKISVAKVEGYKEDASVSELLGQ